MKKTIAIPARLNKPVELLTEEERQELQNYGDKEMTPEEIAAREEECARSDAATAAYVANSERKSALAEKWPDAFDLLDDILTRGIEVVKLERDAIKAENPKGVDLVKGG